MLGKILNIKVIFTLVFSAMVAMSYASFSNTSAYNRDDKDKDKKKDKTEKLSLKDLQSPEPFFSLSSISSGRGDVTSLSSLGKYRFVSPAGTFTEQPKIAPSGKSVEINSSIRVQNGNQVVIYPYSYKLKSSPFSIFKTPMDRWGAIGKFWEIILNIFSIQVKCFTFAHLSQQKQLMVAVLF